MTKANAFFTRTIHTPARGSQLKAPVDSPTAIRSAHIPSENANRYANPHHALLVVVTQVSTAAITGAEQGAATRPDIAPMTSAPVNRPPVPAVAARDTSEAGSRTG